MDLTTIIITTGFAGACALAVYQFRRDDWSGSRKIGTAIVLAGAAVALFGSQLVSVDRYPLSLEVVGTLIVLGALLFMAFSKTDDES